MLNVLLMLFSPATAWQRATQPRISLLRTLFFAVLPLLLLCSAVEGYGWLEWGIRRGAFGRATPMSQEEVIRLQAIQSGLGLLITFVGGMLVRWISEGLQNPRDYSPCYVLAAYGLSPFFLARMLDGVPFLPTWLCWGIGAVGCIHVLYHGIVFALQPSQSSGFALYLVSAFSLVLLAGLAHLANVVTVFGRVRFTL